MAAGIEVKSMMKWSPPRVTGAAFLYKIFRKEKIFAAGIF